MARQLWEAGLEPEAWIARHVPGIGCQPLIGDQRYDDGSLELRSQAIAELLGLTGLGARLAELQRRHVALLSAQQATT
ncbi:MAG: hypothetical protein AAF533_18710 [Acidobacteriota bacterium]